jgi:hypothetical protein
MRRRDSEKKVKAAAKKNLTKGKNEDVSETTPSKTKKIKKNVTPKGEIITTARIVAIERASSTKTIMMSEEEQENLLSSEEPAAVVAAQVCLLVSIGMHASTYHPALVSR